MISTLVQIIIGIVGGAAGAMQTTFNGLLTEKIGSINSVLITYCGGALVIMLLGLLSGNVAVSSWRGLSWYLFLAGPLGLVIIGSLGYTAGKLGPTSATALFIVSSLMCSLLIDQLGLFGMAVRPITLTRTIGMVALLTGTWLVIRT